MKMFNMIALLLGVVFMTSCEDVIELELDNTEARIIIEANLDATNQSVSVIVSESNDFYQIAEQIRIDGAVIELKHKDEVISLERESSGIYSAEELNVRPGEVVEISVDLDNETYTASTMIPSASNLTKVDSIKFDVPIGPEMNGDTYQVFSTWQDMAGEVNYYRLRSYTNDVYDTGNFFVMTDDGFDGNVITRPVRIPFEGGSKVTMELLSTDRAYYNYYLQLSSTQSEGLNSAVPFNPNGNFTNNALGYFGAYHTSILTIQL